MIPRASNLCRFDLVSSYLGRRERIAQHMNTKSATFTCWNGVCTARNAATDGSGCESIYAFPVK